MEKFTSSLPEARHLGQRSPLPEHYDAGLLVKVPRETNRREAGIDLDRYHAVGVDVWHAYEATCLTEAGMPAQCILKIVYSSSSRFLVESKSLKLYLHSLNNAPLGATSQEAREHLAQRVADDLSKLLECEVECHSHTTYSHNFDFSPYPLLEEFAEAVTMLPQSPDGSYCFGSHLLRSRCRITGQPDYGTLYVRLKTEKRLNPHELLDAIVTQRNQFHFHEEMCERIYQQLAERYATQELLVSTLYTRRGGIDISPCRASQISLLPPFLSDPRCLSLPAWRQ